MRVILAMLIVVGFGTSTFATEVRVNLRPGARVCDAAECFVLSPAALSIPVWQRVYGGGIQFAWRGTMLTADAASVDESVQDCGWGSFEGRRAYLCDGSPAASMSEEAPRPARRGKPTPEVAAYLRASGRYALYYGPDAAP